MSKKSKVEKQQDLVEDSNVQSQPDALIKAQTQQNKKEEKQVSKKQKQKKEKKQKEGFFKKLGRKIKEVISELKKVTWPSFAKVVKQTGVVIAVVIIFTVVVFGIDRLLALLFELFTSALS